MKTACLWIAAFAVVLWTLNDQVTGLTCQNGGTCAQKNGDSCTSCSCAVGFTGDNCTEVLMKVTGAVSYNTSLIPETNSTQPIFKDDQDFHQRLGAIFDGYHNSTLEKYSSNSSLSVINFVVYMQKPADPANFNATKFKIDSEVKLKGRTTTNAAFTNSTGILVHSAIVDVDECASQLYVCIENAECYNTDAGYGCSCKTGYVGTNTTSCLEKYCLLNQAPSWPQSATRKITYPDGTVSTSTVAANRVPSRTFIEYQCPDRYTLVNSATGESNTDVIECSGSSKPTSSNSGWIGNDVRCDMTVQYMVAIIMAAVSCVIIVLTGGAFVVAWENKRKKKKAEDAEELEVSESATNVSFQ